MIKSLSKKFIIIAMIFLFWGCCNDAEAGREYYRKGMAAYYRKDLNSAGKLFSLSFKSDCSNLNAKLMTAKICYFEKKYSCALEGVNRILEDDRRNINALYWKARILIMKDRDNPEEAVKLLQRVVEGDSHHMPARMLLALLYEQSGRYSEAFREYALVKAEGENLIDAGANLALLYMKTGMRKKARMEIKTASEMCSLLGRDKRKIRYIKEELEKWEKNPQP